MDARCAALVLSNPGYRTKPEARESLARRAADFRRGGMAAVLPATLYSAFNACPPEAGRNSFERRFARQDPIAYAPQIEGMLDADTSAFLPQIACPTLIVAGARDILLPPEHALQVHAAISGSEYVLIEDGAHFIPWQQPERFARLVAGFLERKLDG
jgi:pimeloyl-ACP methyl ester carboxylesterase